MPFVLDLIRRTAHIQHKSRVNVFSHFSPVSGSDVERKAARDLPVQVGSAAQPDSASQSCCLSSVLRRRTLRKKGVKPRTNFCKHSHEFGYFFLSKKGDMQL